MRNLFIEGTNSTPTFNFKSTGEFILSGRALPENALKLFEPIFDWLNQFSAPEVNIEFNVDYFNTSVSKQLLDMFKIIEKKEDVKNINITWMYEDGDDEMLESGEVYKDMLPRFNFSFHKYAEVLE